MTSTFVFMVRGINVAGARPLKMEKLREICSKAGLKEVRTYLQSGNVVGRAKDGEPRAHAKALERAILGASGLNVSIAALSGAQLSAVVAANPLALRPKIDPMFLHASFLIDPDSPQSLDPGRIPLGRGELAVLKGQVVYLYCPNGYGITKINNRFFERLCSCRATTRNWRTVLALEQMALGRDT